MGKAMIKWLFFRLCRRAGVPYGKDIGESLEKARYNTFVKEKSSRNKLVIFDLILAIVMFIAFAIFNITFDLSYDSILLRSIFLGVSLLIFIFSYSAIRTVFYFKLIRGELLRQVNLKKHDCGF